VGSSPTSGTTETTENAKTLPEFFLLQHFSLIAAHDAEASPERGYLYHLLATLQVSLSWLDERTNS
jgi:hypothetical protein